jgi:plasmid maintenance system antidote protein VapI
VHKYVITSLAGRRFRVKKQTKDPNLTPIRISQSVFGKWAIIVDTALRLPRYFDTSLALLLRLQVRDNFASSTETLIATLNRAVARNPDQAA